MEKIFVEPSRVTPLINFDPEEGILEMRGRSSPENAIQFYQKVIETLKAQGAEGVILGCTEITLLIQPEDATLPVFDTTALHAAKAVALALNS